MAFIPEEKIEEVKQTADIVSIISDYVPLKRSGRNFVGSCPFHHEKTPSFTVSAEKGIFHCFGCGEGGDVISFIMKMESMSYPEAIRHLADRLGIFIESSQQDYQQYQKKNRYIEINEEARRYFFKNLLISRQAQQYLTQRGIDKQSINQFQLGYADSNTHSLYQHLKAKGYQEEELLELGLIGSSSYGEGYYDKYRDRLIFPIMNIKNETIGFGGRTLVNHPAKYINSQDSFVYNKSFHLYGSKNLSRVARLDRCVLVEGYMDVISLYQEGIDYAVASLGTALTKEQAQLIARYTKNIYIAYDGDSAGIQASKKAIEVFQSIEVLPWVISIPGGVDPDDYVKEHGKEAFIDLENQAKDPMVFLLQEAQKEKNMSVVSEKVEVIEEMAVAISLNHSEIIQNEYIRQISQALSIEEHLLAEEVHKLSQKQKSQEEKRQQREAYQQRQGGRKTPLNNLQRRRRRFCFEALRWMIFNDQAEEYFRAQAIDFSRDFILWEEWSQYFKEHHDKGQEINQEEMIKKYPKGRRIIESLFKVPRVENYQNIEYLKEFLTLLTLDSLEGRRQELMDQLRLISDREDLDQEEKNKKTREIINEINLVDQEIKQG